MMKLVKRKSLYKETQTIRSLTHNSLENNNKQSKLFKQIKLKFYNQHSKHKLSKNNKLKSWREIFKTKINNKGNSKEHYKM